MSSANDDKVRARIAEIRAAAGVPHAQVSMEVLYFLPRIFLDQYAALFHTAVQVGGRDATGSQQAAEVGRAAGKGAKPAKTFKKGFVIKDERALEAKSRIDKRLRSVARDIEGELLAIEKGGSTQAVEKAPRCGACSWFLQSTWKYCPRCGRPREA